MKLQGKEYVASFIPLYLGIEEIERYVKDAYTEESKMDGLANRCLYERD